MSDDIPATATLLVFTLGPEVDSRRRPVLPARLRPVERDLRAQCLAEVLAAGRSCGLDLVVATDSRLDLPGDVERREQSGSGFAARLASALAGVEEPRPDKPLVLVGADLPGFTSAHLEAALDHLRSDPEAVVVGPSPDGGFYLLATGRPLAPLLDRIDWCRQTTRAQLLELLAAAGREVHLLPLLADLDRPSDLGRLLTLARSALLHRRLVERLLLALARSCRALLENRSATVHAKGKGKPGMGSAEMNMQSSLVELGESETEVTVESDLKVSGILAQMGRGMIEQVSKKMFKEFTQKVRQELEES